MLGLRPFHAATPCMQIAQSPVSNGGGETTIIMLGVCKFGLCSTLTFAITGTRAVVSVANLN